jgi:hypothetical protein
VPHPSGTLENNLGASLQNSLVNLEQSALGLAKKHLTVL